jgi:MraZ protein
MFSGQFEYSLDDKGRLSIPARFRDLLLSHYGPGLILTNHTDGCLAAYPLNEWQALQDRIEQMDPEKKRAAKNTLRIFYAGATECAIDRLGRILVPQTLRNYGSIKKNVMIVGMNKKIEIWAAEVWAELVRKTTSDKEKMAEVGALLDL